MESLKKHQERWKEILEIRLLKFEQQQSRKKWLTKIKIQTTLDMNKKARNGGNALNFNRQNDLINGDNFCI